MLRTHFLENASTMNQYQVVSLTFHSI